MTWTLEYSNKLRVIELVFTGRTTGLDLRESTSKAIALSKEQSSLKFLIDATEIELIVSTFDLYDLPTHQYPAENLNRQSHVAVVLPKQPKEQEDARFYETACINRGWCVKLFPGCTEGIEWLTDIDSCLGRNTQ